MSMRPKSMSSRCRSDTPPSDIVEAARVDPCSGGWRSYLLARLGQGDEPGLEQATAHTRQTSAIRRRGPGAKSICRQARMGSRSMNRFPGLWTRYDRSVDLKTQLLKRWILT